MKKFYRYGIDLGTTNSCISKYEYGETKVIQNILGSEITPSAVYINKKGKVFVGRQAVEKAENDPENAVFEFKRLMGIEHGFCFPLSKIEKTPQELSAAILEALVNDVVRVCGETPDEAVITVPAAFNTLQCEATYEAARLVGLKEVQLLQEPIAAAIAYGAKQNDNGFYMVFDFGGGTLDVAIVKYDEKILDVINHEGNNYLGGKDIDRQIVDEIIIPEIIKKYSVNVDILNKEIRKLLMLAEEAKIALSTTSEYTIDISDFQNADILGDIDFSIKITIDDLNRVAMPIVLQCIKIAEKSLSDINLKKTDLKEIFLVGGSTYLVLIRDELKKHFGAKINTSVNALTAVAQGAALYSTKLFVETEELTNKPYVNLEYENLSSNKICNVVGLVQNSEKVNLVRLTRTNDAWSSGWVVLCDYSFDVDIELLENEYNCYHIELKDTLDNIILPENNQFEIYCNPNTVATGSPPLPHSISIEVIDEDNDEATNLVKILYKNAHLPAGNLQRFKTAKDLVPHCDDKLTIKIWEGESDKTDLCEFIGNIYIKGTELRYPIPKGSEIRIKIDVDVSRRLKISLQEDCSGYFSEDIKIYNTNYLDIRKVFKTIEDKLKKQFDKISELIVMSPNDEEIKLIQKNANEAYIECFNIERQRIDGDRVMKLLKQISAIDLDLENFQNKAKILSNMTGKREEIISENDAEFVVNKYGTKEIIDEIEGYIEQKKKSVEENDIKGEEYFKNKIDATKLQVLESSFAYWADLFDKYANLRVAFQPADEADIWFDYGEKAKETQDINAIIRSLIKLGELINSNEILKVEEQFLKPDIRVI